MTLTDDLNIYKLMLHVQTGAKQLNEMLELDIHDLLRSDLLKFTTRFLSYLFSYHHKIDSIYPFDQPLLVISYIPRSFLFG